MAQQIVRRILVLFALALASAIAAVAQSSTSNVTLGSSANGTWEIAQQVGSSQGKLIVVPVEQPNRRQTCRVKSFTLDKLVCSRAIGSPRTYLPQQIVALILPGDGGRLRYFLVTNSFVGAAIWGTVVLAGPCPLCAVGTGIVALLALTFAGTAVDTNGQPDSLLYLAPGQHLSHKFAHVKS